MLKLYVQIAHELLALQLLTVLLEEPTDDSVEIAVNFTKEIGQVTCDGSSRVNKNTFFFIVVA